MKRSKNANGVLNGSLSGAGLRPAAGVWTLSTDMDAGGRVSAWSSVLATRTEGMPLLALNARRQGCAPTPNAATVVVAQTGLSAVSQAASLQGVWRWMGVRFEKEPRPGQVSAADWAVGDSADKAVCATNAGVSTDHLGLTRIDQAVRANWGRSTSLTAGYSQRQNVQTPGASRRPAGSGNFLLSGYTTCVSCVSQFNNKQ